MTDRIVPLSEKKIVIGKGKGFKFEYSNWSDVVLAVEELNKQDDLAWRRMINILKEEPLDTETSDVICSILSDYRVARNEIVDDVFGVTKK